MNKKTVQKAKKLTAGILSAALITAGWTGVYAQEEKGEDTYSLTILYNNDIHGKVDRLPQFKTIIDQVKEETEHVLVLNGGDIFMRGELQDQQGLPELEMMNAIGYDAWVLGNHEFHVPWEDGTPQELEEQLQAQIALADFPTLCANVTQNETGELIENVLPYTIKEVGGLDIGIIGVTSMKPQDRQLPEVADMTFESGEVTVAKVMEELSPQTDINIVLSHTGLAVDTKMCWIPGVSAVVGADDHFIITNPIYCPGADGWKSTPIMQAGGENDQYLGRIDMEYELTDGQWELSDFQGYLYDLEGVQGNAQIQEIIDNCYENAQEPAA